MIAEAITAHFGERCDDQAPGSGCAICDAWGQYDALLAALKLARTYVEADEEATEFLARTYEASPEETHEARRYREDLDEIRADLAQIDIAIAAAKAEAAAA